MRSSRTLRRNLRGERGFSFEPIKAAEGYPQMGGAPPPNNNFSSLFCGRANSYLQVLIKTSQTVDREIAEVICTMGRGFDDVRINKTDPTKKTPLTKEYAIMPHYATRNLLNIKGRIAYRCSTSVKCLSHYSDSICVPAPSFDCISMFYLDWCCPSQLLTLIYWLCSFLLPSCFCFI